MWKPGILIGQTIMSSRYGRLHVRTKTDNHKRSCHGGVLLRFLSIAFNAFSRAFSRSIWLFPCNSFTSRPLSEKNAVLWLLLNNFGEGQSNFFLLQAARRKTCGEGRLGKKKDTAQLEEVPSDNEGPLGAMDARFHLPWPGSRKSGGRNASFVPGRIVATIGTEKNENGMA